VSKTWDYYGKNDPYFGVLSAPEFHGRLDVAGRERFFATGASVVERFLGIAESAYGPVKRGIALDYGCGVGRLCKHLGTRFEQVAGVDVSRAMLQEARANLGSDPRFTLQHASELGGEPRFDFLMSSIVFQHIEPPLGLDILRRVTRLLKTGAVGVIDVPVEYRGSLLRRCARRVKAAAHFGKPIIPMYWYREADLRSALEESDVRIEHFESPLFRYAVIALRRKG
jgi:SAM-dependent methyltransferase